MYDIIPVMDRENKIYEINYLITPLVPEDKVVEEIAVFRKIIEDNKGFVVGEDQAKMQKLSYSIKKFDSAYYGWFKFSAGAESIDNIKNGFNKNEKVLRALITEAGKENVAQFAPRKNLLVPASPEGRRQTGAGAGKSEGLSSEVAEKVEIKPEQIDKKLEEILKESSS